MEKQFQNLKKLTSGLVLAALFILMAAAQPAAAQTKTTEKTAEEKSILHKDQAHQIFIGGSNDDPVLKCRWAVAKATGAAVAMYTACSIDGSSIACMYATAVWVGLTAEAYQICKPLANPDPEPDDDGDGIPGQCTEEVSYNNELGSRPFTIRLSTGDLVLRTPCLYNPQAPF